MKINELLESKYTETGVQSLYRKAMGCAATDSWWRKWNRADDAGKQAIWDHLTALAKKPLKEDWGSSDWHPVMRAMDKYIEQGYSIEEAANRCADRWYQEMGWAEAEQAMPNIAARYKRLNKISESLSKDLEDAVAMNWLSWPASKIVAELKKQMKAGKWASLKGKSDDELEDLVDDAKDSARNKFESIQEGMYVVKNKDGVEKRFKDTDSDEAKAWKDSSSKKSTPKVVAYTDKYWEVKEGRPGVVMPWKSLKYDEAATDAIQRLVELQFGTRNVDWTFGRASELTKEFTTCAAIEVRVTFEYGPDDDMGVDEPTSDSQTILVARNRENPKKIDFIKYL